MHYNLLWGLDKPMPTSYDPRTYLAPSWSRASVTGQVGSVLSNRLGCSTTQNKRQAEIFDVHIKNREYKSLSNGEVLSGRLQVRGPLLKVRSIRKGKGRRLGHAWFVYAPDDRFIGKNFPDICPAESFSLESWYCLRIMQLASTLYRLRRPLVETLGIAVEKLGNTDSVAVYKRIGVWRSAIDPRVDCNKPKQYINDNWAFDGCPDATIKII